MLDKNGDPVYMSGIPNLALYPTIIAVLRKKGFTEKRLEEITNTQIQKVFRLRLPERELNVGQDYSRDYCMPNVYAELLAA